MGGKTSPKQFSVGLPFPSFPMLRSSLPNPAGEVEDLAQTWDGGRNAVSARRNMAAPDAHRAFPRQFPKFGAVAPPAPHQILSPLARAYSQIRSHACSRF